MLPLTRSMRQPEESKSTEEIEKAAQILKSGGVVVFPTDTVYGIGCLADNQRAVDRIYKIKARGKKQLFPILVSSINQVEKFAEVNQKARELANKHWPGGLTIIMYDKQKRYKVGLRIPASPLVKTLIEKTGSPVIGTSANFHNNHAPRSYEELDPNFIKLVDFVIKGECNGGVESTVVDTTVDPPKVLRQGAIALDTPGVAVA